MDAQKISEGFVSFQTEGRLLQELGERLVASPEVALVELIKNAYDADSANCEVSLKRGRPEDGGETAVEVEGHEIETSDDHESEIFLSVADAGHGMTLEEFKVRWMTIATSHKTIENISPVYGRRRTGQKGIGRFAVRFLGDQLVLSSVADDKVLNRRTRVVAKFDWPSLDRENNIGKAKIPYDVFEVDQSTPTGTQLRIRNLKHSPEFITGSDFRAQVLKIVSPLEGLERGRFESKVEADHQNDPGFRVLLPSYAEGNQDNLDLGKKVLDRCWAKLSIDLADGKVTYKVKFNVVPGEAELTIPFQSNISKGCIADIRFFPRRGGVFRDQGINGTEAWKWVRNNVGVAVIDHGFRIKPYGFEDNDWLNLDYDIAHSRREWRSKIAGQYFPMSQEVKSRPKENPALNLATNFQLIGAVFVESASAVTSSSSKDLMPSMDREGFLDNDGFDELFEVVRGGLEFLANEDRKLLLREEERKAKEAAKQARADFRAAVEYIENSQTLTQGDKSRLIVHYTELATKLDEVEQYDREARRKLETMSLLGAVAGFMTHEATRIIAGLQDALDKIQLLAKRDRSLGGLVADIQESYDAFRAHMDYTAAFINAVHLDTRGSFKSEAQVRRVIEKFGHFANERGILVQCEIDPSLVVPPVAIPIYSGILLNLYTNALKAILATTSPTGQPRIVFRGWNDPKWHFIEVLDTGIGIPPELHKRIFDPLFTTTSRLNNPLGSGMGLGLSLVDQLLHQLKGKIEVVDPPPGFSTCIRFSLPRG